jgi:putative transposase
MLSGCTMCSGSLRDVELLLAERGVVVSYETIRRWCEKFGRSFASRLRRRRPRPGDKWHLDEVFVRIQGVQHYLWRGVDQHGVVLDILVQERRDAKAAKRFFRRLLKIVTDKLRSYGVAKRHLFPDVEHRQSRYLNNRAENSHRPTCRAYAERGWRFGDHGPPSVENGSVSFRAVEFGKFRPSTPGLKLLPGQRGQSRFSACAANAAQWREHVPAFGIGIAESFAVRHSRDSSVPLIQCSSVHASVDIDS